MVTDFPLAAADSSAREAALDTSRSYIVQAPAGSGKTELLIQRYLRLLATVENPEEVLAITFTVKAAAEMRLRVVHALQAAREGVTPESAHERTTYLAAVAVVARSEKLGWKVVESPRRMRIQTLDAFSAGIARALPLSSGLGPPGRTAVDEEMNALHRAAAAATLDWLSTSDRRRNDVESVLQHLDNNTAAYVSHVSRMLAARDQWLPMIGGYEPEPGETGHARQQMEISIAGVVQDVLTGAERRLPPDATARLLEQARFAASNLAAGENTEHPLLRLASLTAMPAPEAKRLPDWRALVSLLLVRDGNWRRRIDKRDGFPATAKDRKQQLLDLIEELRGIDGLHEQLQRIPDLPECTYSDEQWQVLLSLFSVLRIAVVELRRLFEASGVTDHTEVALAAGTALGTADSPGEMAMMLDYRIRHLLVDEMQDTSMGQYRLLEQLTEGWQPGDGRTIFCVGDPMQSIYRFRDAEVGRFLRAQRRGLGSVPVETLVLRQNFRSGEHLVHWFNTAFGQIMPASDDVNSGAIRYSESIPVSPNAGAGLVGVHPIVDATPEDEAAATVALLKDCHGRHPRDSIAVLVRSRTHLTALLPQLRNAGLEYQAVDIDRLTDLPEIIDVLALVRALSHEGDRLAWLALLRSPWVGLRWADLHALVLNNTESTIPELLKDPQRVATLSHDGQQRLHAFAQLVDVHCKRNAAWSLRERAEAAWFALRGPASLQDSGQLENVYRFFDVVASLETAGTLPDSATLERQLDGVRVSASTGTDGKIQIMTMHRAKGLQFDHVFLVGLGRMPRSRQRPVLSWLNLSDGEGNDALVISPVGARSEVANDRLHQYIESVEKQKDAFELERLLYVGCTRAVTSLHLVASVSRNADGEGIRLPDSGSLLRLLWPVVSGVFEQAAESAAVTSGSASGDGAKLVQPPLRRLRDACQLMEPAPLPRPGTDQRDAAGEEPVSYHWVGAAARHAGTILHRLLHRSTIEPGSVESLGGEELAVTIDRWARQLGVSATQLDDVRQRVTTGFRRTLEDANGHWLLNGPGDAEYALTGKHNGQLHSVVIDRVRIDENGNHWIVDYKSSTHEGGDLRGFLQQESERHREQLRLYKDIYSKTTNDPVRTALYFPMLQRLLEVDVDSGDANLRARL
ncbi:MAG: UvrD-helicase domain-containing protein [Gammaproteobacteria bacterium]|nr:UvrD-helicase domain-containing protein [Gammaproteobacteria bacterium]